MAKRISALVLTFAIVQSFSFSAFANVNSKVVSATQADTSHPYAFFVSKNTSAEALTVYTGGGGTAVGNSVITQRWTGTGGNPNPQQMFEHVVFSAGGAYGYTWGAYSNVNLVLNARRTTSTPEMNMAKAIGNYRGDIEIFYSETSAGSTMRIAPRGSIQTTSRYIKQVSAMSATQHYTNWNTTGTVFYMYDVGRESFI